MANNITVAGRLGRDAEVRNLPDGTPVVSFTLADSYYTKGGNATNWFDCSGFGQRYEKLASYLTKGTPVTVFGSVSLEEYVTRDGSKKTTARIRLNDIALQGAGHAEHASSGAPATKRPVKPAPAQQDFVDTDADIPF